MSSMEERVKKIKIKFKPDTIDYPGLVITIRKAMCDFAEKESLDRAIEELEKIISDGATHYRRAWIERRIAELKVTQKGEGK